MAKTHCGVCGATLPAVHPVIEIEPKMLPGVTVPSGTLTSFVHFCNVVCVWKGGQLMGTELMEPSHRCYDARGVEFVDAANDAPRTYGGKG